MSNTRTNADGFRGDYPKEDDWVVELYRANGMEPPWLLEWRDGKPIGPAQPPTPPVPRHEA
ncbi:hypothetical protein P5G50_18235 [Leifsonia sp. F6_8S_P_1B]|uniref:Uncharacterized protein n=1 Tax=Leifsonia williamsii TaxID=3035919 RepID=A0ABT8KG21_9MICO|nr:hypothetical protein [Leifsonia williamsii]MDN4616390.1 hypothetical protein [Leifsonia williamsii]